MDTRLLKRYKSIYEKEISINIIIKIDKAEPKFQLPIVVNCCSIRLPTNIYFPPPRRFGITKFETAGINTIVIPEIIPGILSGKITFLKAWALFAPKS